MQDKIQETISRTSGNNSASSASSASCTSGNSRTGSASCTSGNSRTGSASSASGNRRTSGASRASRTSGASSASRTGSTSSASGNRRTSDTSRTRRIATVALLAALAMVLGWLEQMIPLPVSIPGVKLGLANICVLFALYRLDTPTALLVMLIKVASSALLFGSLFSLVYSASGSILAFVGIWVFWRLNVAHLVAVSVVAAILHNLGQLTLAFVITATPLIWLNAPVLVISACITGILTGTVATQVLKAMPT